LGSDILPCRIHANLSKMDIYGEFISVVQKEVSGVYKVLIVLIEDLDSDRCPLQRVVLNSEVSFLRDSTVP